MRASLQQMAVPSWITLTALLIGFVPSTSLAQDEKKENPLAQEKVSKYSEELVSALRQDASYKVRLQAAVFLGRSEDERAFEPLVTALSEDEHYTVRAAAAMALADLNDPRAISHILKQVATDPDPFVREEASRALQEYDREEALPFIVATYGSDNAEVRAQAVKYLAASPDPVSKPVLIRALGDEEEIYKIAKAAALDMAPDKAMEFLDLALGHRDAAVRRGAVRVLHAWGTEESANLILKVYERDIEADGVRAETRKALRDLRGFLDIDKIVKNAVSNPQKHSRAKALKLLGVIGGKKAEKVLLDALEDKDVYLRGTAVMAMADLGDPAMVPSLEKLEIDPANQRILHLVRHTLRQLKKKEKSNQ